MRGRLINPFLAKIAQLDTIATSGDPDAGGPLGSGYDNVFREVVKVPATGESARKEKPLILVPCQVEVGTFQALQQLQTGNAPDSRVVLVFHFRDLERMGLVDTVTGEALLRIGDRLEAIHKYRTQALIQTINLKTGGLFITESQPQSFGLSGGARNLLLCTFEEREQGFRG